MLSKKTKRTIAFVVSVLFILTSSAFSTATTYAATTVVNINGSVMGRSFEGVGAVSAGASSNLLLSYSNPYRSDILDYLFKPNFGAGLQHLKVEIGGDTTSTDGSEPSHAHTRAEMSSPNYNRGYEYWLMKEARLRNSGIYLEGLEWGAPGWFTGGFFSQDNSDYIVKWLQGARDVWGVNVDYVVGAQNEFGYDRNWIVNSLRPTLNANGFSSVKINAPDDYGTPWGLADTIVSDSAFSNAIYSIGYHYPSSLPSTGQLNCGHPLWSSEDWWSDGTQWTSAYNFAKLFIKYSGSLTKFNVWAPIDSMYNIMPGNTCNTGIMKADTPWSGHYDVTPTIWACAHITQFALPGWKYIDSGIGTLPNGGSYATLKKSDGSGNYSIIAVSGNGDTVTFNLSGGLSTGTVYVWKSNSSSQFVLDRTITPSSGSFTITFDPNSIYSLTTTTGQTKGVAPNTIPANTSFSLPYSDDFESYTTIGAIPKYFSDQGGSFEIANKSGGGKVLRQSSNIYPIQWGYDTMTDPGTIMGDQNWSDYSMSADVMIESSGYAGIIARADYVGQGGGHPINGYHFNIYNNGTWKLYDNTTQLQTGSYSISLGNWYNLKLDYQGSTITAYINNNQVAQVSSSSHSAGLSGFDSGWNYAQFDNLSITGTSLQNLALGKAASASSQWDANYSASKANDGDSANTRWNAANGTGAGEWLQIDFGTNITFNKVITKQFMNRIAAYKVQYWNGSSWVDAYTGGVMGTSPRSDTFAAVVSSKVRLNITSTQLDGGYSCPSVYEFEVYNTSPNTSFATAVNVGSELRNDYGDYVGMKITVGSSAITVKELGRYFVPSNSGTHTLKIIRDSDKAELGNVSLNMGSGTADALGFKYATLSTPVTLAANTTYYIVSLESNGGDQWYGRSNLPALTTTNVATVNTGVYASSGTWITYGAGGCYVPVNFKY